MIDWQTGKPPYKGMKLLVAVVDWSRKIPRCYVTIAWYLEGEIWIADNDVLYEHNIVAWAEMPRFPVIEGLMERRLD